MNPEQGWAAPRLGELQRELHGLLDSLKGTATEPSQWRIEQSGPFHRCDTIALRPRIRRQPTLASPDGNPQRESLVLRGGDRYNAHIQSMAVQGIGGDHHRWTPFVHLDPIDLSTPGEPSAGCSECHE